MRLGQTSIVYLLSKSIGSLLGFLATVYFARVLGEEVLGQYALVLAVVTWIGIGGRVGIDKAITKRISEGEEPQEFAGAALLVMGTLILIIVGLVIALRTQINDYVGVPVAEFVILILLARLYRTYVYASLKGKHLVHIYAILTTAKQTLLVAAQVTLVVIGLGLTGMLWGYAIGHLVIATVGLLILGIRPALPKKRHVVSLFDFAKFAWLGNIRGNTFDSIDIAVLGFFVTQGLIGIYSVAWSIGKFLDIFGSAVSDSLFPEMSLKATDAGTNAVTGLTEDALSYSGLILVPGFIGGVVIGDRLLQIYGENFPDGYVILIILIAALLVYTYVKQLLNTLNAIDRPDLAFRANGAFIVSNVALNVLLVYLYGWIGAAVATALSAVVGLIFAFYYARQLVDFAIPYGEVSRQWAAALFMGVVVYLAREATEPTVLAVYNEVFVVLLVGLGAGVYFLTYLAISTTFRDTVRRNLPVDVPLI